MNFIILSPASYQTPTAQAPHAIASLSFPVAWRNRSSRCNCVDRTAPTAENIAMPGGSEPQGFQLVALTLLNPNFQSNLYKYSINSRINSSQCYPKFNYRIGKIYPSHGRPKSEFLFKSGFTGINISPKDFWMVTYSWELDDFCHLIIPSNDRYIKYGRILFKKLLQDYF